MFGCECFWWWSRRNSGFDDLESDFSGPKPFSLPSPLPEWPQGEGFSTGRISLGELEVVNVTEFESIWNWIPPRGKKGGVTFYRPANIPDGFFCLGHYCQPSDTPLRGYVLAAREVAVSELSALEKPLKYTLVWSSKSPNQESVYVWQPKAPVGYKTMGFIVTNEESEPELEEVRCIRNDLIESCEACEVILNTVSTTSKQPFRVWNSRPCKRGMFATGVPVGAFFCSTLKDSKVDMNIHCLKNLDSTFHAMPNVSQIHALIKHYGPTVFFHPDEKYMPSSVPWFFENGALLYKSGKSVGVPIDKDGSNLPKGGKNDFDYWIDLPEDDDERNYVKLGNIESAELYAHVKPALGGSFTDIALWIFCPFNGPATIKAGLINIEMNKVGEHVSDWEHFTLRLSNFTGELWSIYFSEHSGGEWVDAWDLEFIEGNRPIVYASKCGHASFPHAGSYIRGSSIGIGVRNDVAQSEKYVDSSSKYKIVAAEYLGDDVEEPDWLQYMRDWGPTIVYDSRSEINKIINLLPFFFRFSVEILFDLFPTELYGEEGPTGPKEKDNWIGDER